MYVTRCVCACLCRVPMTNASALGSAKKRKLICRISGTFCETQDPGSAAGPLEGLGPGCGTRLPQSPSTPSFLLFFALLCLGLHTAASASSLFFTASVRSETVFSLQLHLVRAKCPHHTHIDGQRSGVSVPLGPHCGCARHSWMRRYRCENIPQTKPELKVRACVLKEPWRWPIQHSTETHRLARLRKDGWLLTCLFWMWKWLGPYCIASSLFHV